MSPEINLPDAGHIVPSVSRLREAVIEAPWILELMNRLCLHSLWTYEHSIRVGFLMGELNSSDQNAIRAGLLHDIGKIQIPRNVLDAVAWKEAGRRALDDHPRRGFEIVREHDPQIARIIVAHHEPIKGYPRKKSRNGDGELAALQNLLSLVDATDALMSERPYKPSWKPETVEEFLRDKFDPELVGEVVEIRAGLNS